MKLLSSSNLLFVEDYNPSLSLPDQSLPILGEISRLIAERITMEYPNHLVKDVHFNDTCVNIVLHIPNSFASLDVGFSIANYELEELDG